MKKILFSSLMLMFLVGVTPAIASADGGMMPSENNPLVVNTPITASQYNALVNQIVVSVLEIFNWENDEGAINFADNKYSAQYDCNTIFGSYTVNGTYMNLGTPAMTMMACEEEAMDADRKLAESLSATNHFTFKDGKLVMTGKNTELSFKAVLEVKE